MSIENNRKIKHEKLTIQNLMSVFINKQLMMKQMLKLQYERNH